MFQSRNIQKVTYGAVAISILLILSQCTAATLAKQTADNPFRYEYTELLPLNSWKPSGNVSVHPDGRVYLTKDGSGSLTYRCILDMSQGPYLMIRMGDSLPGPVWTVQVSGRAGSAPARYNLLSTKEEGEWLLPFKQDKGWSGQMEVNLTLDMKGRLNDWIVFDCFRIVHLTDKVPAPPRSLAPSKDIELRNFAVQFIWQQVPNAVAYEIQFSQTPDFAIHQSQIVNVPFFADRLWFLPEKDFAAWKWHWRVRGINKNRQTGEWSLIRTFNISDRFDPTPPERNIARDAPLIILHCDPAALVENWKSLDSELKLYTYLRIEALRFKELIKACESAEKSNVPILIQVSGPHDFYGPLSSRISLSEIEGIFQKYKMVKGAFICEQACQYDGLDNPAVASYLARLIKLAAHYGKLTVWADAHWGRYQWLDVYKNEALLSAIELCRDNFVPVWKMNCGVTAYSVHSALLGLWLSGQVKNWGVEPEKWYWFEAGLHDLGQQKWFKEGATEKMPPVFYGQMFLLGVASGASVYVIEPPNAIWEKPGQFAFTWQNSLKPLIHLILKEKIIPDKETVQSLVKYAIAFNRLPVWQWDYDRDLAFFYRKAYKPATVFDVLPKTNNYFVPVFAPAGADTPFLAAEFDVKEKTDSATLLIRKEGVIIPASSSVALVVQYHNNRIVMNTDENTDSRQDYEVTLSGDFKFLSGVVETNGYLIVRQVSPTTIGIRLFGRAGKINGFSVGLNRPGDAKKMLSFHPSGEGWKMESDEDNLSVIKVIPQTFSGITDEIWLSTASAVLMPKSRFPLIHPLPGYNPGI
jgi:hypothetical protein